MSLLNLFFLLMIFFQSSPALTDENQKYQKYTGHSHYRLLLIHQPDPQFNPNDDLIFPSKPELLTESQQRTLKREKIEGAILGASLKSIIPLMTLLQSERASGQDDQKLKNIFELILNSSTLMRQTLAVELESLIEQNPSLFPMSHEIYLAPWNAKRGDLFYSAEKITIEPSKYVNVLGVNPKMPQFSKKLTEEIKTLQKNLFQTSKQPVQLLGFRYRVWLDPHAQGEFSKVISIRVLLGLQARTYPFIKDSNLVKIHEIDIPKLSDRQVVAVLKLDLPITTNQIADPTLRIDLGDFQSFEEGEFKLFQEKRHLSVPRLRGRVAHEKFSRVAVDLGFKNMDLNLKVLKLSSLDSFTSAGLRLKGANFTIGGLHLESVDQELQNTINANIDQQIQDAIQKGKSQLDNGLMKLEWIEEAFLKIMGAIQ